MASQNELKELLSPENLMALLNSLPDVEGGEGDDEKTVTRLVPIPVFHHRTLRIMATGT